MNERNVGRSVLRVEDDRLLNGSGMYVADCGPVDALHCAFVRSPIARGYVEICDSELPEGVRLFSASDLKLGRVPSFHHHDVVASALREQTGLVQHEVHQPILADGEVAFVGQPVAVVLAANRYQAEDAVDAVQLRVREATPVLDVDTAQAGDAPAVSVAPNNCSVSFRMQVGEIEGAFAEAEAIVGARLRFHRQAVVPIEPRGAVARWADGRLTIWSATQIPHALRATICRALSLDVDQVRVIVPDVGGGFGAKGVVSAEELTVAALASRLGEPVRWSEDRAEQFVSAIHARDQTHRISVAADGDGILRGLRDDFIVDCGAFDPFGKSVPYNTAAHVPGPYRIGALAIRGRSITTNKVPAAPYRGSGRPEATFARERVLDRLARTLGVTPFELRRRNLLDADDMPYDTGMPYRDGVPLVYDGPDCRRCLEHAERLASELELPPVDRGARRGVGVAAYSFSSGKGPYETAAIELGDDGAVTVLTGATSQGQAHETVWAQICADELGLPIEACHVVQGDTDRITDGWGTMASRSAVNAGNAIVAAAGLLRDQLRELVAAGGDVPVASVRYADGQLWIAGRRPLSLSEVAALAARLGEHERALLRADAGFEPPTVTWGCGVHVATVDVDVGLRTCRIVDYVAAFDHGPLLNPAVVEGQMHGAIVQGIGGALFEDVAYDERGRPAVSLAEYLLPTAAVVPRIRLSSVGATPTDRNALGVRGLGEAGTVAPAAAIANAVETACAEFGVRIDEVPLTPARLDRAFLSRDEKLPRDPLLTS
jgi:aerobic carbon-monoxide dehydrogenase large subunit